MADDNHNASNNQRVTTVTDNSNRTTPAPDRHVAARWLRLPQYWPVDSLLCIAQVNSQFTIVRVTSYTQKFNHLVSSLPLEIGTELHDLILQP